MIPFLLLPHGSFCDSGPLVADALLALDRSTGYFQQQGKKRTVVLIGTEHACTATSFLSLASFTHWRTPLGDAPVNRDLWNRLKDFIPVDNGPFLNEHSIENQLPFLQYLAEERGLSMDILPLSVKGDITSEDYNALQGTLLDRIAQAVQDVDGVAVIATTDFSHVGPAYGVLPPGWPNSSLTIPDYIRQQDKPILDAVVGGDSFYLATRNTSMCGRGAVVLWLRLAQLLRGGTSSGRAQLLRYNVGSDIGPKNDNQTGFATFMIS
jgi:AmmeMemoRadiSam system protein B